MNRAYLGEQRVPDPDGGEIRVIPNCHAPLVTAEIFTAWRGRP